MLRDNCLAFSGKTPNLLGFGDEPPGRPVIIIHLESPLFDQANFLVMTFKIRFNAKITLSLF